jgi:DNA modification methylase
MEYLYHGDCFTGMKSLKPNSVDLVVTSPPYNFDMNYSDYDDKKKWDEYFKRMSEFAEVLFEKVKVGGRVAINIQPLFSDFVPSHHYISEIFRAAGFKWRNEILWEKNNYNCKFTAWGSWKSASNPYFKYTWEFIEVFSKEQNGRAEKGLSDITADEFKAWTISKWSIAPERKMKAFGHPAMFPQEIPNRLIKLFSYVGDTVLDPFMGLGTTGVICRMTNRNFIGHELSRDYFERAVSRIESTPPNKACSGLGVCAPSQALSTIEGYRLGGVVPTPAPSH